MYLASLAAAADKDVAVFADFTLSVEMPTKSISMRAGLAALRNMSSPRFAGLLKPTAC